MLARHFAATLAATTLTAGAAVFAAPAASAHGGTPCDEQADACVDLSAGKAWLMQDGNVTYGPVPISSGKPGYETPTGTYPVTWKDRDHRSREYDNAPMPYAVFFGDDGIAFHYDDINEQSHGCVRLQWNPAEKFYNELQPNELVQVQP